jgi:Ca2+-binding EF-hand superfamily protein
MMAANTGVAKAWADTAWAAMGWAVSAWAVMAAVMAADMAADMAAVMAAVMAACTACCSQEEIDQGRANQLKKFDKDGDGTLNLAEYEALWLDAKRERMVDRFQGHDADGDGKVTAEEFGERFADMVKFMDSNDDGVLDESDMRRRYGGEGRRKNDD